MKKLLAVLLTAAMTMAMPVSYTHLDVYKRQRLIRERKLFPCFFGSALKMEGVKELLEGIDTYGCLLYTSSAAAHPSLKEPRSSTGSMCRGCLLYTSWSGF